MASLVSLVCCAWTVLLVVVPPSTSLSPPWPPSPPPDCRAIKSLQKGQTDVREQLVLVQQQLATLQSVLKACPAGWSAHGDSCFLVATEGKTADEAAVVCQQLDRRARLATLRPEDREHVHGLVNSSPFKRVWIGLRRVPSSGYGADGWQWSDGSQLEAGGPWLPSQPDNNGGEDCVQYDRTQRYSGWTQGWSDERCQLTAQFVCQISLKC